MAHVVVGTIDMFRNRRWPIGVMGAWIEATAYSVSIDKNVTMLNGTIVHCLDMADLHIVRSE